MRTTTPGLDSGEVFTETDGTGRYFLVVAPGNVILREIQQPGFVQTFPFGDGAHRETVFENQTLAGLNFGNDTTGNSISDQVPRSGR